MRGGLVGTIERPRACAEAGLRHEVRFTEVSRVVGVVVPAQEQVDAMAIDELHEARIKI